MCYSTRHWSGLVQFPVEAWNVRMPFGKESIVLQSQVQSGFFTFFGVTGTTTSSQKEAK
jgi:hypothetical protein